MNQRTASLEFCRRGRGCIHARAGNRRSRGRRACRANWACLRSAAPPGPWRSFRPACWVTGAVIAIWRRERFAPSMNPASGRNARSGPHQTSRPPRFGPQVRRSRTRLGDPPPHRAAARSSLPPRRDDRAAATLSRPACASFGRVRGGRRGQVVPELACGAGVCLARPRQRVFGPYMAWKATPVPASRRAHSRLSATWARLAPRVRGDAPVARGGQLPGRRTGSSTCSGPSSRTSPHS